MEEKKSNTKVHAVIIQKGGSGKTTTVSNLGYVFANAGYKVLLIDNDSQASLTGICNVDIDNENGVFGMADLYSAIIEKRIPKSKEELAKYIIRPTFPSTRKEKGVLVESREEFGFDLIPADILLADTEVIMNQSIEKSGMLMMIIIHLIKKYFDYDYIFIDCAPGLSIGSYNAIGASLDGIIVPCTLETMALRGVENLIEKVAVAQRSLGSNYVHKGILGIVMNQYAERRIVDRAIESEIKRFIPIKVFDTVIPESSACKKATYIGYLYSQMSKKAREAFEHLMEEIIAEDKRRENETESLIIDIFGKKYEELHREELKNKGE